MKLRKHIGLIFLSLLLLAWWPSHTFAVHSAKEVAVLARELRSRSPSVQEQAIRQVFAKYGALKDQPNELKQALLEILSNTKHPQFESLIKKLHTDDLADQAIKAQVNNLIIHTDHQNPIKAELIQLLPSNACNNDPELRAHFVELLQPKYGELRALALSKLRDSHWIQTPTIRSEVIAHAFRELEQLGTPDYALMQEFFRQIKGHNLYEDQKFKKLALALLDKSLNTFEAKKYPTLEILESFNAYDWYPDATAREKILPHLFQHHTLDQHNKTARTIFKGLKHTSWHQNPKIKAEVLSQLGMGENLDVILSLIGAYDWPEDSEIKNAVLKLLDHPNHLKRQYAIDFLNQQNWHAKKELRNFCQALLVTLKHPDYLRLLDHYPNWNHNPAFQEIYLQALKSHNPKVKEMALERLLHFDWPEDKTIAPLVFDILGTRSINDRFDYKINQLIIKSLKGRAWDQKPKLKAKLLLLLGHEFDHDILELLKAIEWHQDPEIRARIIELLKANHEDPGTIKRLLQFLHDYHWVDDLEIRDILMYHLRYSSKYTVPLMHLMLSPKALAHPELMVAFSNMYLQLPKARRLELLGHNIELFSMIYHPQTEFLVLQDMAKIMNDHYLSPDFKKSISFLKAKLDHPEARKVLEKYMRMSAMLEPENAIQAAELLFQHPKGADLAAKYYFKILQDKNPKHNLFDKAIDQLEHPAMLRQLELGKYVDFLYELKEVEGLSKIQRKQIEFSAYQLARQQRNLEHMNKTLFPALAQAIEQKNLNQANLAMNQHFFYNRSNSAAQSQFANFDDIINHLYSYHRREPLMQKKVAQLEALELANHIDFNEREMRFMDFIATLDNPREYMAELRARFVQPRPAATTELDKHIHKLRQEGRPSANDPLGRFTREIQTRDHRANRSLIECIIKNLN